MKHTCFALLFAVAAIASAQWFETAIPLPDSLAGVGAPAVLALNETNNRVYVGGGGGQRVVVLDGSTRQPVGSFLAGSYLADIKWSRAFNRVYTANTESNSITVADGATNQVVANISYSRPWCVAVDDSRGKLYVGGQSGTAVIDMATNTVTREIPISAGVYRLVLDPARSRVYAGGLDTGKVTILDADADTIVCSIALAQTIYTVLALDSLDGKLYCFGGFIDSAYVIDLNTNSIKAALQVPPFGWDAVWNPVNNMVYVACHVFNDHGMAVIDCRADTLAVELDMDACFSLAQDTASGRIYADCGQHNIAVVDWRTNVVDTIVEVGRSVPRVMLHPDGDIYAADDGDCRVVVRDAATLAPRAIVQVGTRVGDVAWNSTDNQLYAANISDSSVSVVDGATLQVLSKIHLDDGPFDMLWVEQNDKLYCTTREDLTLWVIDCGSGTPVAELPCPSEYNRMAFSATSNEVFISHQCPFYSSDSGLVSILDGTTNALLARITTDNIPTNMFWYADSNWMFVSCYHSITVIDCATRLPIDTIPLNGQPTQMAFDSLDGKLYASCFATGDIAVINPASRQLLTRVPVGDEVYPIEWDSRRNVIYCAPSWAGQFVVIDCATDSVVEVIAYEPTGYPVDIRLNTFNDKVYMSQMADSRVMIFDAQTRTMTDSISTWGTPSFMVWDPATNRTFIPGFDGASVTVLRDAPPGITDAGRAPVSGWLASPTLVRGRMLIAGNVPAVLLNAAGQIVADLKPGANDVSGLASGVYFYSLETDGKRLSRKVVLTGK